MIKMAGTWFYIFLKRMLCRKSFVAFLLLLPIMALGAQWVEKIIKPSSVSVGIVYDEADECSKTAAAALSDFDGAVTFLPFENEQALKNGIRSQSIQWGYVFSDNLEEKLRQGQSARLITCFQTPASAMAKMTDEIIFASIMESYGKTILIDYVEESSLFTNRQKKAGEKDLPGAYESYRNGTETFSFVYKTLDGTLDSQSPIYSPIQGLCSLLIYIGGIFGATISLENDRMGLYKRLSHKGKAAGRFLAVLAPVCLLSISAAATLLFVGGIQYMFRDLAMLLVYCMGVSCFCFLCAMLFQNENMLCGTIPVITLGSLLCCPVFIDLSVFYPIVKTISWLFLPSYYIRNMPVMLAGIGLVCMIAGISLSKKKA